MAAVGDSSADQASPQRSYVRATATASTIDAAFRTQLEMYWASAAVNAGPYALRANSGPVILPSSLAGGVLGVTGLDNAGPILPLGYQSAAPGGEPVSPAAATAGPAASSFAGPATQQERAPGVLDTCRTTDARHIRPGYSPRLARPAKLVSHLRLHDPLRTGWRR